MFTLSGDLTDDIINSKYQILKDRIWQVSLASAAVAAIPVPGLDVAVNVACICKELLLYHNTFGFGQQIVIDISKHSDLRKKISASSIIETMAANEAMRTFVITQLGKLGTTTIPMWFLHIMKKTYLSISIHQMRIDKLSIISTTVQHPSQ
jgi:uncharacterized protein (DUF697 family)